MDLGLDGIILAVLFLWPGFIASYVHFSTTPDPARKKSVFQETLGSLSASVPIFLLQFGIVVTLVTLIKPLNNEFNLILQMGISKYALLKPFNTAIYIFVWVLLSLTISVVYGFADPIDRLVERNLRRSGVYPNDLWFSVLEDEPKKKGFSRCYSRVWLKSGVCYAGYVHRLDSNEDNEECRYLFLENCKRWPTYAEAQKRRPAEAVNSVLLSSIDIDSIDVWW